MKRIMSLCLALAFVVAVSGCGGSAKVKDSKTPGGSTSTPTDSKTPAATKP